MWATIFHFSYVQIFQNDPFNKIRGIVGSISDWVSERFPFMTNEASAEKLSQTVLYNLYFYTLLATISTQIFA